MPTHSVIETYAQLQEAFSIGFKSARFVIPGFSRITPRNFRATVSWCNTTQCFKFSAPQGACISLPSSTNSHLLIKVFTVSYYVPVILMSKPLNTSIWSMSDQSGVTQRRLIETAINSRLLLKSEPWVAHAIAYAEQLEKMELMCETRDITLRNAQLALYNSVNSVCCVCFKCSPRVQTLRCGHYVACAQCNCKTDFTCIICNTK